MRFNNLKQRTKIYCLQIVVMAVLIKISRNAGNIKPNDNRYNVYIFGQNMTEDFKARKQQEQKLQLQSQPEVIQFQQFKQQTKQQLRGQRHKRADGDLRIIGLRIEESDHDIKYVKKNIPSMPVKKKFKLRVFGFGITAQTVIAFTDIAAEYEFACLQAVSDFFTPYESTLYSASYSIIMPAKKGNYYVCAKNDNKLATGRANEVKPLIHMGSESYLQLATHKPLIPLWALILLMLLCLMLSALFSGLNLGLMALDRNELRILCNTGTEKERHYARIIWPVRNRGNYLLCSILLGNVLVNSTLTIMLDSISTGWIAVVCSTLIIVIFGEIIPQAVCSRYGLLVGAKTIYLTKAIMIITAPLSFPISLILDWIMGEEIGSVYNRERLRELIILSNEEGKNVFDKIEMNIISGALEMRQKTVSDIMTPLGDAFMLSMDAILDFETISDIMRTGFSRIPVYEHDRQNIVTLLYIKDLAFVDADDKMPLRTLCDFYQNKVLFVDDDLHLNVIFDQFRSGNFGHLAVVQKQISEAPGTSPKVVKNVGLVTLEDVIEELIQEEIIDETDVLLDNRTKIQRHGKTTKDFSLFTNSKKISDVLSPQMTLATFQFLSTTVPPFHTDWISETVLRRLLQHDIVHHIKVRNLEKTDSTRYIFQIGKPADTFVLITEGRVEVQIGAESLHFESGPFSFYGTQVLLNARDSVASIEYDNKRPTFVPDYLVRAITDVIYIGITGTLYMTARRATILGHEKKAEDDDLQSFVDN